LEFWQIWSDSIPPKVDLPVGMNMEFHVATSADMQKTNLENCWATKYIYSEDG